MTARPPPDFRKRLVYSPRRPVRPLVSQCVEEVGDRYDPCLQGNALARYAVRIARAVPPFVMTTCDALREPDELGASLRKHSRPNHRVHFHQLEFLAGERPRLEQDAIGDA